MVRAASLSDGAVDAAWIEAAAHGDVLEVKVLPGSSAAPIGEAWHAPRYVVAGKATPPGPVTNLLAERLGDGTRRYRWQPPADVDLAGVELRYAERPAVAAWEQLEPLHNGFLTGDHWETVEPQRAGDYTIAARAVDTSGNLSTESRYDVTFPPTRQGDTLVWDCPSAEEPTPFASGTIVGATISRDARRQLEGNEAYDWASLATTTWADVADDAWGKGPASGAGREMSWTSRLPTAAGQKGGDLGAAVDVTFEHEEDATGTVNFEVRVGATPAALAAAAWASSTDAEGAAKVFRGARYFQVRWRITGDGSQVLTLDHCCYSVHAPSATVTLREVAVGMNGKALSASGDYPIISVLTDIDVTVHGHSAKYATTRLSPPSVWVWNSAGGPDNGTVSITLRGARK